MGAIERALHGFALSILVRERDYKSVCALVNEQHLPAPMEDLAHLGDIDTHGFAILNRARSHLPGLHALLMDETTLLRHRDLWVQEREQHGAESLPNLTEDELAVYRNLKQQIWGSHLRLEQERISWPEAWFAVKTAHGTRL